MTNNGTSGMSSNKPRMEISRAIETLTSGFFNVFEDIEIHIPQSVMQIDEDAFSFDDENASYHVDIFYDGTIDEWNHLKKGLIEEKTTEDWYGYYYHNGPRYETNRIYYSWFKNYYKGVVIIHCSDGDTKPDSSVDRKHPAKVETK